LCNHDHCPSLEQRFDAAQVFPLLAHEHNQRWWVGPSELRSPTIPVSVVRGWFGRRGGDRLVTSPLAQRTFLAV
jgi:hypothetical protein